MGNHQQSNSQAPKLNNGLQINIQTAENDNANFLKPITFEQFGNSPSQSSKVRDSNQLNPSSKSVQSSRYVSGYSSMRSARLTEAELKLNQLTVIKENDGYPHSSIEQELTIPFSVVRLKIDKGVMKTIKIIQPDFLSRYEGLNRNAENQWKINPKTYYYKRISDEKIAITKSGYFYEGGYVEKDDQILPDSQGILFTAKGMYRGEFCEGEAHGRGTFIDRQLKTQYEGRWTNGELTYGKVSNEQIQYEGRFLRSIPDGQGALLFKQKKCSYTGIFREGLYEDENGFLASAEYDYSGGFKEGKKWGKGCLIEKQRNVKSKNKRYRPQQQYDGEFQNDCYKGKSKDIA